MATITYTDKVALYDDADVADINKVKADDMNEIKTTVNTNYSEVGDITDLDTTDQTSVVSAVNELVSEINDLQPVTLYEDETGTASDITLSDSIENYKYIGFYVRNNSNSFLMAEQRFFTNNSSTASVQLNISTNGNGGGDLRGQRCILNGTSVTMSYYYKVVLVSGSTPSSGSTSNTEMYVYKVVGYQ